MDDFCRQLHYYNLVLAAANLMRFAHKLRNAKSMMNNCSQINLQNKRSFPATSEQCDSLYLEMVTHFVSAFTHPLFPSITIMSFTNRPGLRAWSVIISSIQSHIFVVQLSGLLEPEYMYACYLYAIYSAFLGMYLSKFVLILRFIYQT